jgi:hypothetical protein
MIGPALLDLLWSLAETPTAKRSTEQKALFEELALLFAASARPEADQQGGRLHAKLRSRLKIKDLRTAYITRPELRGRSLRSRLKIKDLPITYVTRPEGGTCPCCGQDLP